MEEKEDQKKEKRQNLTCNNSDCKRNCQIGRNFENFELWSLEKWQIKMNDLT